VQQNKFLFFNPVLKNEKEGCVKTHQGVDTNKDKG
jgi:hypothetical protein